MTLDHRQAESKHDAAHSTEAHLRIVHRMRRAFLSMSRCGDTLFSPYGMTTDQYALMRGVQREPGMRQADLGSIIFAEPNTVTAMVTLLEKRGIVRRKPSPTDRRAKLVYLTPRGEKVMQRLSDDWQPMRDLLNECFAGRRGQEALKILDRVYEEMTREREKLNLPTVKVMSVSTRSNRAKTSAPSAANPRKVNSAAQGLV